MLKHLISIITVTYNADKTLEQCIQSILSQTEPHIELIVIDGGSTDNTLSIIKKYSNHLAYWVSEPDTGIYDAMNKGIKHMTGDWVLFLGADDQLYENNIIEKLEPSMKLPCRIIAGSIVYDHGKLVHPYFNWKMYLKNTIHHQGVLYHRTIFTNYRYPTIHKISSDYALNLHLFLTKMDYRKISLIISRCGSNGESCKVSPIGYYEEISIREKLLYNMNPLYKIILNILTYVRFLLKKTRMICHVLVK